MPLQARKTIEDFMARQTAAVSEGDADTSVALAAAPHRRLSMTHDALLETEDQIRTDVRLFKENAEALGVNLIHRQVKESRPLGARYIEAIYTTHLLNNATPMIPPYEARIVIARNNNAWQMIEMEWQVVTAGWLSDLRASTNIRPRALSFAKDDIRGKGLDPMACYQAHLESIGKAEREDDYDAYLALLRFPHSAHSMQMDKVYEDPSEVRPFYEMIRRIYNGEVGDHLERVCDRAEFLGSDMLVGYHTGRAYKNGVEVIEPVTSRMILQWNGTHWQLLSVANTIQNKTYPFDMYAPGAELMTDMDIQKRTQEWPNFLRTRTPPA